MNIVSAKKLVEVVKMLDKDTAITLNMLEDLFSKQKFYLYEDDKDEFVSMEKDREYYSIKHK